MYFTKNLTTVRVGQCSATCLKYSVVNGSPLITWELLYPRYIHSELMTHRVFSRNAASSRATPVTVLCDEVASNPVFFGEVGLNERGMVATKKAPREVVNRFRSEWEDLGRHVAETVRHWAQDYRLSKQVANRALEPWLPIRAIVTATDLDNFFELRLSPDAQPEMQDLAHAMLQSAGQADVCEAKLHLPYEDFFDEENLSDTITRCVAACARVSVGRHDGKQTTVEEDEALVKQLLKNGHMTPFEHIAAYEEGRYANFENWVSLRWLKEHMDE
jgi:thymidylate synthase ThyX